MANKVLRSHKMVMVYFAVTRATYAYIITTGIVMYLVHFIGLRLRRFLRDGRALRLCLMAVAMGAGQASAASAVSAHGAAGRASALVAPAFHTTEEKGRSNDMRSFDQLAAGLHGRDTLDRASGARVSAPKGDAVPSSVPELDTWSMVLAGIAVVGLRVRDLRGRNRKLDL
jgi:hypothetical protein